MKKVCLALACGLAMSAPAHAKRPSYSFFEVSYLKPEVDGASGEEDGLRLAIAASMTRWIYFTGGYDHFDAGGARLGLTSLGFGAHTGKSTGQLFSAVTYERIDLSVAGLGSADEDGYGVQLGGRLPAGMAEFQLDYKYVNFGDNPDGSRRDEDRYRFSALAHLTRQLALTGSYAKFEQASDVDEWTVGLRVYFNNKNDAPRKKRKRGPVAPPPPPASAE